MAPDEPRVELPQGWRDYAGRWIACVGDRLIGQGGTPGQALQAARAARHKETPRILYMPTPHPLTFIPLLEAVREHLPADRPIYLVGGAVRDALLGKAAHDLDFALASDASGVARRVAKALKGAFFWLDDDRGTVRVIVPGEDGARTVLDFALLRGPDLESDLLGRDFTINAMAVEVSSPQALLDPLGGAADLYAKALRACSPRAMLDDPARVLRGVRLAAEYGLKIQPQTRGWMRAGAQELALISAERRRDELFRILNGPSPAAAIRALDALGALEHALPELRALKGLEQSPPHVFDVWSHTLITVERLADLLGVLAPVYDSEAAGSVALGEIALRLGRYRGQIAAHLAEALNPNRSLRALLMLAALYHDVAKPVARQVDERGRIHALGHDKQGAAIVAERARQLALSNAEVDRLSLVVRQHMRPHLLAQRNEPPSRRAIYRFFRDCGEAGVDVCLLALADVLATFGHTLPQDLWAAYLEVVRALFDAWWEAPRETILPTPLLDGHALQAELGLAPGPVIGRILEALREAQATEKVRDREQARAFARAWLDEHET